MSEANGKEPPRRRTKDTEGDYILLMDEAEASGGKHFVRIGNKPQGINLGKAVSRVRDLTDRVSKGLKTYDANMVPLIAKGLPHTDKHYEKSQGDERIILFKSPISADGYTNKVFVGLTREGYFGIKVSSAEELRDINMIISKGGTQTDPRLAHSGGMEGLIVTPGGEKLLVLNYFKHAAYDPPTAGQDRPMLEPQESRQYGLNNRLKIIHHPNKNLVDEAIRESSRADNLHRVNR